MHIETVTPQEAKNLGFRCTIKRFWSLLNLQKEVPYDIHDQLNPEIPGEIAMTLQFEIQV